MPKTLMLLFLIFSAASSAFAQIEDDLGGAEDSSGCYTLAERRRLAGMITDFRKCQADLTFKNDLITKEMLTLDRVNPGPAFWQDPSFVFGGIVVGVAVGSILTLVLVRGH